VLPERNHLDDMQVAVTFAAHAQQLNIVAPLTVCCLINTRSCAVGMSFCLPVAYYKEWKDEQLKKKEDLEQPLLANVS